ncbi:MAG: cation diffusion facilitator family transporter [Erysipelotrichaceae bacterium]
MIEKSLGFLIKDHNNIASLKVREQYGIVSSLVGIFVNTCLFIAKFLIGSLSNSISITSDAFNNLSDAASCIFTLLGYKLAAQPADEDHPFGHGRIEYLVSLVVAAVILFVGFEFFVNSLEKIFQPEAVVYSHLAAIVLIISIAGKLWLAHFNTVLGHKIHSSTMLATAQDSKSDVWATTSTLIALVASLFTTLPVDGLMGCVVSFFILKAGYGIIRETVDTLIGSKPDPAMIEEIEAIVCASPSVIGIHDLVVHNYGPGRMMASLHAEIRSDCDLLKVHDEIDLLERKLKAEMHLQTVIHMDPIEVDDVLTNEAKALVIATIEKIDPQLSLHDFRMVNGEEVINLIFDLVVPFHVKMKDVELKRIIEDALREVHPGYHVVITFDHAFG